MDPVMNEIWSTYARRSEAEHVKHVWIEDADFLDQLVKQFFYFLSTLTFSQVNQKQMLNNL